MAGCCLWKLLLVVLLVNYWDRVVWVLLVSLVIRQSVAVAWKKRQESYLEKVTMVSKEPLKRMFIKIDHSHTSGKNLDLEMNQPSHPETNLWMPPAVLLWIANRILSINATSV